MFARRKLWKTLFSHRPPLILFLCVMLMIGPAPCLPYPPRLRALAHTQALLSMHAGSPTGARLPLPPLPKAPPALDEWPDSAAHARRAKEEAEAARNAVPVQVCVCGVLCVSGWMWDSEMWQLSVNYRTLIGEQ